jgi:TPR repeat protein
MSKLFHRSDYETALDHYRKAKRRGDVVDAQRWLKLADMHLRVADRFDAGVNVAMERDADLRHAQVNEQVKLEQRRARCASASMEGISKPVKFP